MQENKGAVQKPGHHTVYLLRCWQESDGRWRYSVQPADGRDLPRRGFVQRAALLEYLQQELPD